MLRSSWKASLVIANHQALRLTFFLRSHIHGHKTCRWLSVIIIPTFFTTTGGLTIEILSIFCAMLSLAFRL